MTLAGWASVTTRARLGLMVAANTFRQPALLLKQITALDHMSAGRAVLGLGAGWFELEHRTFGIPFGGSVGMRLDWLEGSARRIRGLLDGNDGAGRSDPNDPPAANLPPPLQRRLPLLIGGAGERRTLAIVARYADAWNIGEDLEVARRKVESLQAWCARVGRDPREIEHSLGIGAIVIRRSRQRRSPCRTGDRARERRLDGRARGRGRPGARRSAGALPRAGVHDLPSRPAGTLRHTHAGTVRGRGRAGPPGRRRSGRDGVRMTSEGRTLHMIGIAHLDPVWLWRWPEGYAEARATIRAALDLLDADPDYRFTCDSVAYYEWIEDHDPELFQRLRRHVAEGRWEPTGGWWVEPDCNIPSGESFVRQGLYGQRYLRQRFGRAATVGMNVDPFGHAASLPAILRGTGLASYVFHRPGVHEQDLPGPVFRWRSADGSEVLAYRIPHEYCGPEGDLSDHVASIVAAVPDGWSQAMAFYGVGDHGGGPTRANLASIRELDSAATRLRFSTPDRYFAEVAARGIDDVPVVSHELQHHAVGCYSARSWIKAANRRIEQALVTAEMWATASTAGYPVDQLARAWRGLCFNQFHDILAGTAIDSAYDDARDQLGEAAAIADRVLNRAIQRVAASVPTEGPEATRPLLVFNTLPWPVEQVIEVEFGAFADEAIVTDADGAHTPVQTCPSEAVAPRRRRLVLRASLPPLGYQLYRLWPASHPDSPQPPELSTSASVPGEDGRLVLENDHLRAVVDPLTGWLAELVDRRSGRSFLAPAGGGHAEVFEDPSDTWAHGVERFDRIAGRFAPTSIRLIEDGPVRQVVRVELAFGDSRLREDLLLEAHARHIEIRVMLDWYEHLRGLKLRVPTTLEGPTATFDIPFGSVERPPSGHEEPGQLWLDVMGRLADGRSAGVSVVTDAKYAFDVHGGDIGITAVRSPVAAWHDPVPLGDGDDHRYLDQGRQRFRYAILPHAGDWRSAGTARFAAAFNRPPIALLEGVHPGAAPAAEELFSVGPASVEVAALKLAEDGSGDAVLRIVERHGRDTLARIQLPRWERRIGIRVAPWAITTVRVPRDPRQAVRVVDLLEDPLPEGARSEGVLVDDT